MPFGHNVIFRYLFGWLLPYNFGLLKRIRQAWLPEEATNNFVLQDFGLPLRHLMKGIEFYHDEVEVYPIWLCPAKAYFFVLKISILRLNISKSISKKLLL